MAVVGYTPESPDNGAIRELRDEIKRFVKSSDEFGRKSLKVARAMFWLTIFIAIGLAVQIFLAMMSIPYRHVCNKIDDVAVGGLVERCFTTYDFGLFGRYSWEDKEGHLP